ncbi:MAG TPA: carboxymuconolactone decarboxylase family protein [Spirochaetia bacterium]
MPENPLSAAMKLDPKLVEAAHNAEEWAFADGALPAKVKILMAMAFDAAHGAANGVRSLAQRAMQAGATKEEIGEALRVAYVLGGVGSVFTASAGLKDLLP